jgi:ribonuclease P protein component
MLRRRYRLAHTRDIERAKRGRAVRNADFVVRAGAGVTTSSRATVVVPKTVAKRAVDRNRIKRQVRALLIPYLKKAQPARDMVISIKPPALRKKYPELRVSLQKLLQNF